LNGVKDVKNGFKGSKEINTVTYDPQVITPQQMVEALKAAGTYLGTAGN
jgi:hypothetical protein